MTGPILPRGHAVNATAEAHPRFTVAQPLSAFAAAKRDGRVVVAAEGGVFTVRWHPVRRCPGCEQGAPLADGWHQLNERGRSSCANHLEEDE